ncbi:hypothetical protein LCGC14_0611320 [marine sediment metagenome]|uniref:Uncharacterized protein n=1 Tax=marine sediment metagenome TaxID=412755 RepID=A0A0F9R7P0_9ZZZZ
MFIARKGTPIPKNRVLKSGEKRFTLILKPGGYEYKFEPKNWNGKDVQLIRRLARRVYLLHKYDLRKRSK